MSSILIIIKTLIVLLLLSGIAAADNLIVNGNFESDLAGWTDSGINGGIVRIETEGTDFSGLPGTPDIVMISSTHAVNIRSSGPAPIDSIGALTTSNTNTPSAGSHVLKWWQKSERQDVYIELQILDEGGVSVLKTIPVVVVTEWTEQSVDLSEYIGTPIMIRFRQHTTGAGYGYYTLLDDIETTEKMAQNDPSTNIPEFPTVALPVAAVIGMIFLFRKKGK